jgi:hypothetical protein
VILATDDHQHVLAQELRCRGIDVEACVRRGRYVTIDAAEILSELLLNNEPDFRRFRKRISRALAGVNGVGPVRNPRAMVYGELVSLLWEKRQSKAVLMLEELWEDLAREFSFSLFCGYSIAEFAEPEAEEVYVEICTVHSTVIPSDQYPSLELEQRILRATARSYPDLSLRLNELNRASLAQGKSGAHLSGWQLMYDEVLSETDPRQLFDKIERAEPIMRERLTQLDKSVGDPEHIVLIDALSHLGDLRRTKLGFTN